MSVRLISIMIYYIASAKGKLLMHTIQDS